MYIIVIDEQKCKVCGWAALLQTGIALVLFLLPGREKAHWVFLGVALSFLIICFRLKRDLRLLRLADQQEMDKPPAA